SLAGGQLCPGNHPALGRSGLAAGSASPADGPHASAPAADDRRSPVDSPRRTLACIQVRIAAVRRRPARTIAATRGDPATRNTVVPTSGVLDHFGANPCGLARTGGLYAGIALRRLAPRRTVIVSGRRDAFLVAGCAALASRVQRAGMVDPSVFVLRDA